MQTPREASDTSSRWRENSGICFSQTRKFTTTTITHKERNGMAEKKKEAQKIVAQNKKAWHDYFVDEKYEAGIALCGTEIKSIRRGAVNLKDSYCTFEGGEMFATGVHISPYEQGNRFNHIPLRDKKLLMHKREIMKLQGLVQQKGYTLIPLSLYFSGSYVKMEIGLCRGKKLYDKRDADAERQANRTMDRHMKDRRYEE